MHFDIHKIKYLLLVVFVSLFTGCFEPTGKVNFKADKDNAVFYVDGKEIDASKPVKLVVKNHIVKVIVPIDKRWEYVGEKSFMVQKDSTIDVDIKTMKMPTEYEKQYEKQLASFDPLSYEFKLPPVIADVDKDQLKTKVDKLLSEKDYDKISPMDIKILGYEEKVHTLFEQANQKPKVINAHSDWIFDIAVESGKIVSASFDNTVKVWDLKTQKLLKRIQAHPYGVMSVTVANGKIISGGNGNMSGTSGHSIRIWDLNTGKLLKTLRGHKGAVNALVVSGEKIISGSDDNTVKIWSLKTGKLLKTLHGHKDDVLSLQVTDGKIISGSKDNTIKIWSLKTGKLLNTLRGHKGAVRALTVTKDKIISGSFDDTIKIWSLKTGTLLETLTGQKNDINAITVYNGKIISGGDDKTIKIWDLSTGDLLKILYGHNGNVMAVKVVTGKIISASSDHTIRIWNIDLQKDPGAIDRLEKKVEQFSLPADNLGLIIDRVYKYGKIGEVYVPSVSYTSSTPETTMYSINGHTYNQTTYTSQQHTSGGYNTDLQGYKAVNRITNNHDTYYFVEIQSTWKGKYASVSKSSDWGGDEHINWEHKYQNGEQINYFLIPPHKYVKYQFEVGEEKSPVKTQILSAYIVPKEYAEKLYEALDEKNEAIVLIDKFLKDKRISAWHDRLADVKNSIIEKRNEEFDRCYEDDVKVKLILPKNYDADFGGDVVLTVTAPRAMCVKVSTPFGTQIIKTDGGVTSTTFKGVKDLSENPDVSVKAVVPDCN